MEAGVRGVGAPHAVLGARSVIEKVLDSPSQGALLQVDVKQYSDHIDPMRCASWMQTRGACPVVAAAAVRHQLLPGALVRCGRHSASVGDRARGSFIGSRTTGALGRITCDLHEHVAATCSGRAVGPAGSGVILSTYVDNVLFAAKDDTSAEAVLAVMRQRCDVEWGLELPDSSVEPLLLRGAAPSSTGREPLRQTKCLGHILSHDGTVAACFARARSAARTALWRHIRAERAGHIWSARRSKPRLWIPLSGPLSRIALQLGRRPMVIAAG